MSLSEHLDPEILHDFITESAELLESLDKDLVTLEQEPDNLDLLNRIFRSIHTIKGSSSFLGLAPLTDFAHAAEDALNALRKGQVKVSSNTMDFLLAASDILRRQLEQVQGGALPETGPASLIQHLRAIGAGTELGMAPSAPAIPAVASPAKNENEPAQITFELSASKLDLVPFMVDDLLDSINQIEELLEQTENADDLIRVSTHMAEITNGLLRSAEFFEMEDLCSEIRALESFATVLQKLETPALRQARIRALALLSIITDRANALRNCQRLNLSTDKLLQRLSCTLLGQALDAAATLAETATAHDVLIADGILQRDIPAGPRGNAEADETRSDLLSDKSIANDPKKLQAEQTIRVDVERLESLLNLVGELVLQKNRVLALSRRAGQMVNNHDFHESITQVASDLDRVTGQLQLGVMKTRMQPLSKIFNRYPRVIRDLAHASNKQIELVIEGGETEVDKSVIEQLADPLVHILRNSADHGLESADARVAAGKPPCGTIYLAASHEGNHVLVQISDDGQGLDPQRIGRKAVERGLITPEELATMSEGAIHRLIFVPGFSTAEKVSDLSGRGVGMDVVKTNINKLNGSVDVTSRVGEGTTVTMKIPLTVAIMQAMMVKVNDEIYALPLSNILEIVKPENTQISTINNQPVMRLRDEVLPLIDLAYLFGHSAEKGRRPYAVVIGLGPDRVGLMVHRLIGQEEVVIKPLDEMFDQTNLVSGATVREDGGVSLIVDIAAMMKSLQNWSAQ